WYEHMVRALRFTGGKRFVVVDYDRFLEQPEAALGELAAWLGLSPTRGCWSDFGIKCLIPGCVMPPTIWMRWSSIRIVFLNWCVC
ncbi:hypothetical protein D0N87_31130, partial [Pseudomonas sp. ATCC 13867]